MLVRSSIRTITLVSITVLMFATCAANAFTLTADKYLKTKNSLGAISDLSSLRYTPSACVGKTIELVGKVSGTMKSNGHTSFLLNTGNESYVINTQQAIAESLINSSALRILVKVGQGSATSLSDLTLQAVALDYDVTAREKQLAAKASEPKAVDRSSNPATFYSARYTRGTTLSSRAMQIYNPYRAAIAKYNSKLTAEQVDTITSSILSYSEQYGVDPRLVIALITAESNFKPSAVSRCGAMGLCQLMPGTARGMGVDNAFDPEQNIAASIRLIKGHMDKFGDLSLSLAAYNAGAGAVKRHGGVPPYRETRNYIAKITKLYKALCGTK